MLTTKEEIASAKAIIGRLLSGFPSAQSGISRATPDAYIDAVSGCSLEAIERSYRDFVNNTLSVGGPYSALQSYDPARPPSSLQFGMVARHWQVALDIAARRGAQVLPDNTIVYPIGGKAVEGGASSGPNKIDYGSGMIDMSWMTPEQKHRVLASNGKDIPRRSERRDLVA